MARAKVPLGTLYYVEQTIYKAEKALVAAKFNGVVLKTQRFDPAKDTANPEFLNKNPTGKVPFLETDFGTIVTSNAIARYIARCRADTSLYGKSFDDEGKIDSWLEFGLHELEVPLMTWVYPVLGLIEDLPQVTTDAQADVKKALSVLEARLAESPYLVGDFLSLADIALVIGLKEGFARVFDAAFRKPFPKVTAWFESTISLPQFKAVVGEVKLCVQAEKPKPFVPPPRQAAPAPVAPAKEAKAKTEAPSKPKEEKPAAKAAAAPAPDAGAKKEKGKDKKEAAPAAAPAPAASAGAGLSAAEAEELERIKQDIVTRKAQLKADGLSGGQINKDAQVTQWVARLNELKAKAG